MKKIDSIEKTVNTIVIKVPDLEAKDGGIETRLNEVEQSCTCISTQNDSNKTELTKAKSEIETLTKMCKSVEEKAKSMENEKLNLESKLLDLECRSMRENLLFYGIAERAGGNCETLVQDFCKESLHIENMDQIGIDRAHRVGPMNQRQLRPIVVKFQSYKGRETVRSKSFEKEIFDELKRTGFGVGVQWPKQIRDTRRESRPIMQREKDKGNRVRLYVNDRLVNPGPRPGNSDSSQTGMET